MVGGAASSQSEVPRPDLRLVAPAALAWLSTGWVLVAPMRWALLVAGACLLLGAVAGGTKRWQIAALFAIVAVCVAVGTLRVGAVASSPLAEMAGQGAVVRADVVLDGDVRVVGQPGRERERGEPR